MSESKCPVNGLIRDLEAALSSRTISIPREQRILEEVYELVRDVAWGRAGEEHLAAVEALAGSLADSAVPAVGLVGQQIAATVNAHREVFQSHVITHNCAAGECMQLVPAPCQMTCPAGIDVPSYVNLIALGRYEEAIAVIRKDNPFPWVCGLVCTRPCEYMCVRGRMDQPVSIKFIKGYAAEKSLSDGCYTNPPALAENGKKIAVVGAGPAGMSAAYYLALKGYRVRIIEAMPMAGGMMMFGIPRYRLPREVIDREAAMLEQLGVEFLFNIRFGQDVTWQQLKEDGFEALLVAVGAQDAFQLDIQGGGGSADVVDAVTFLRQVALGKRTAPGNRVMIVGGGNVAIDAARTCLRLGSRHVTIAYRRTRNEMPADVEEVEQAEEEGVEFSFLTVPVSLTHENSRLRQVECLRTRMAPTGNDGRLRPVPVDDSRYTVPVDTIIYAIGQKVQAECLSEIDTLKWTRRNTIDTNVVTMETNIEGVFAAGDAVTGPATVVEAIGGGKRAAEAIDRYLSHLPQPKMPPVPKRRRRTACVVMPAAAKTTRKRPEMPLLNIERRRTTFQQVELGYTEDISQKEAARCLRCDICVRCGRCVSICRDQMGVDALHLGYLNFDAPGETDLRLAAERCILCGACAANCPTGAMQIEDKDGERILSLCGTQLNRQPLLYCEKCGAVIGPARYLDFVKKRVDGIAEAAAANRFCDTCARKEKARFKADVMPV